MSPRRAPVVIYLAMPVAAARFVMSALNEQGDTAAAALYLLAVVICSIADGHFRGLGRGP